MRICSRHGPRVGMPTYVRGGVAEARAALDRAARSAGGMFIKFSKEFMFYPEYYMYSCSKVQLYVRPVRTYLNDPSLSTTTAVHVRSYWFKIYTLQHYCNSSSVDRDSKIQLYTVNPLELKYGWALGIRTYS
eukprot:SAG31_NODE_5965_length_2234_cov_75.918970_2_plen_132_part_00